MSSGVICSSGMPVKEELKTAERRFMVFSVKEKGRRTSLFFTPSELKSSTIIKELGSR